MPFEAGTRLGPYEVIAPLGAGGMGEVYRARDTRLDRTVAIKALTGALAVDSTAGGTQVRWSADAKEIFYVAPDGKMMAVSIAFPAGSQDVKLPVPLFQTHLATGTNVLGYKPQYAVSRDGRFLLNTAIESASAPIVVSVNWMKRLTR